MTTWQQSPRVLIKRPTYPDYLLSAYRHLTACENEGAIRHLESADISLLLWAKIYLDQPFALATGVAIQPCSLEAF